jgi:dTDP-4-amino-4,6-dideoxygalactose transaminase
VDDGEMPMKTDHIPFNKPYMTGKELHYISQAHFNGMLAGDGPFTHKCHKWFYEKTDAQKILLTHSCTAALEMASMLINTRPGDEIIMPSFTFVSTANAFVLRGGVPIFVDIREDTLNIDENIIEDAITSKTKAIVPVHYAGVACEMDVIMDIAGQHKLKVVEDAAQGVMATYKGRSLGSIGDLGAYSFHETKNVISGEGGALLINDPEMNQRAEVIREKGTDRSRFFRGEIDKYTWQEAGSSFLPGELTAAFLSAQLEEADSITARRLKSWQLYHNLLGPLENVDLVRRPIIPQGCLHNAHMYYVLLPMGVDRQKILARLEKHNINCVFHYVPLHSSPAGQRYGKKCGDLKVTDNLTERLIRLPLWVGLTEDQQQRIVHVLENAIIDNI